MNEVMFILKKFARVSKGMFGMIGSYKLYFLLPICLLLALLVFFIYYIGPTVIVSFIYAGV